MRLVSFEQGESRGFGLWVKGQGVVDASSRTSCPSLRAWIGAGLPGAAELASLPADHALSDVRLLAPIPDPAHIVGIGLNTRSHFEETAALKKRTPGDYPKYPRLFLRSPDSLVAHGQAVVLPSASDTLDYEGEIGLVIARRGRNLAAADWRSSVLGMTCFNDGSVRGFQLHSDQVTAGKNFQASGAIGPCIVTLDELPDIDAVEMRLWVNGEQRQHLTMPDLIFPFGKLLAYVSQPFELQPGDVIATGSPEGIGALSKRYLKAGDEVRIQLALRGADTPLMTLRHGVVQG